MHKALHSRDSVDWLFVSRKEGGGRFAMIEDSVDASRQWQKRLHRKAWKKTYHSDQKKIQSTRGPEDRK